jgi:hypothetical protein
MLIPDCPYILFFDRDFRFAPQSVRIPIWDAPKRAATVKLARALWIVPLSIGTPLVNKSNAHIHWPWFILFFCVAAVAKNFIHTF